MLDAFRNLIGGKGRLGQKEADQLELLVASAREERTAISGMLTTLRETEAKVKQAMGQAGAFKGELDQVRSTATKLAQDYTKIRETSREAREDATAAITTVKEIEKKLGPLAQIHEMSQNTEERLTALNALAEHVSHEGFKALASQQEAVEHAVVQANRVNEMVREMDVQIGKLNEGDRKSVV